MSAYNAGIYMLEPYDIRMMKPDELLAEVRAIVTEPVLTETMAQRALLSSIREDDHRQIATITYDTTFDCNECEYDAPCSGMRIVSVGAKCACPPGTLTETCFTDVWFEMPHNNAIRLACPIDGDGRITMSIGNRYIPAQCTAALTLPSTTGSWSIYLEGQPEIPGSGVIRICGDPWVYTRKAGVTFSATMIDSSDMFDSEVGLPVATEEASETYEIVIIGETGEAVSTTVSVTYGQPAPTGNHTALYAQRLANCSRLADSDISEKLEGVVVEWPLLYVNGVHKEYLVAMAISKCYTYMINSSRSDKDVNRFATLQKHWQDEAARLSFKLPKSAVAATKIKRVRDDFRSTFPLRSRRSPINDGRLTGVRRIW